MEKILHQMAETLTAAATQYNKECDEHDQMVELIEMKDKVIEGQIALIAKYEENHQKDQDLLSKQNGVIQAAIEVKKADKSKLNVANATIRELQKLNPKRLQKVCKEQRKSRIELKKKIKHLESVRKEVVKRTKQTVNDAQNEGRAVFHTDDKGNALRVVPALYVGENNEYGAVPHSPILEFICQARGITRQGMLMLDGTVSWASAANSSPSTEMSLVARNKLLEYCQVHKIKVDAIKVAA